MAKYDDDDDEVSLTESLDRHARYLGIDPVDDSGYMWIAREALDAELPSEWIEVDEEEGEFAGHQYYYNTSTGESSWDHPIDARYKEMFKEMKETGEGLCGRLRQPEERNNADISAKEDTSTSITPVETIEQQRPQQVLTNSNGGATTHPIREEESVDFIQGNADYVDNIDEYRKEKMMRSTEKTQKKKSSVLKSFQENNHNIGSPSFESSSKKPKESDRIDFSSSNSTTTMSSEVSDILREERTRRSEAETLAEKTEQMLVDRAERAERLVEEEQGKRKHLEKELHEERKAKAKDMEFAKDEIEKSHGREKIAKQKLEEEVTKFKEELGRMMDRLEVVEEEKDETIKQRVLEFTGLLENAESEKNELRQRALNSENSIKSLKEAKSQAEAKLECKDVESEVRVKAAIQEAEKSYKSTSDSLKEKLLACQEQLELREQELASKIQEFNGKESKIKADFSNKTEEVTLALKESENEAERLRAELANSDAERLRLEAQCEALQGEVRVLTLSNDTLKRNNLTASSVALQTEEVTLALKGSENEVERLRAELADSIAERSRLEAQCEALQVEAEAARVLTSSNDTLKRNCLSTNSDDVLQLQVHEAPASRNQKEETDAEESTRGIVAERGRRQEAERAAKVEEALEKEASRTAELEHLLSTIRAEVEEECQILQNAADEAHTKMESMSSDFREASLRNESQLNSLRKEINDKIPEVASIAMKHAMEKLKPAEMMAVTAAHVAAAQKQVQDTILKLQAFQAETVDAETKRDVAERLMLDKLKTEVENLRYKLNMAEVEAQSQDQQQQSSSSFSQESVPATGLSQDHTTTQEQQVPLLSSSAGRTPQLTQGDGTLTFATANPAQVALPQPPLLSSPTAHKSMPPCRPPSTPFPRTPLPSVCSSSLNIPRSSQKPAAISVSPPHVVRQIVPASLYPGAKEEVLQNNNSVLATLQERVDALQLQTRTFMQESLQALNAPSNESYPVTQLAENTSLVNWYRTQSELQDERISRLLMQATTKLPAGGNVEQSSFSSPRPMTAGAMHLENRESPPPSLDNSSLSILSLPVNHPLENGYHTGYWRNRYNRS